MASSANSKSRYTHSSKLEDQAASAALHMSQESSSKKSSTVHFLDDSGKLSSAGAATSLKYAKPQDLPSFPSVGLSLSSASAAASLADSKKKPFVHWQPSPIPTAAQAANQAKDYQMDPVPGRKESGGLVEAWRLPASEHGASAAGQAFGKKPPGPIMEREVPADVRKRALQAATLSMAGSRRRAESAPIRPQPPEQQPYALKAAHKMQTLKGGLGRTLVPKPFAPGDPGFEASRIQNMAQDDESRKMYTSTPPVAIEVAEQNRKDTLRASSVAMARNLYTIQQKQIEDAKKSNTGTPSRASHADEESIIAPQINSIEEAARKLAHERLAKLQNEHEAYRQYYGQNTAPQQSRMSRRFRNRAVSDSQGGNADEEQARRIRSQMTIFQSKYDEVDAKKRTLDREALMEHARQNVKARMATMDDKVFQETGKASPHQREIWEQEAKSKAQENSDQRMANYGKVHVGGGKFLDQSEIEAIARARLQPTLDDLTAKAESQRAQDEAVKQEKERLHRESEAEKTRQAQAKAEQRAADKKVKEEAKARKAGEKKAMKDQAAEAIAVAKAEKEKAKAEAAAEKERLRLEQEQTSAAAVPTSTSESGSATPPAGAAIAKEGETAHDLTTEARDEDEDGVTETKLVSSPPGEEGWKEDEPPAFAADDEVAPDEGGKELYESPASPTSPGKSGSKVKSWFKTRFRSGSKSQKDEDPPSVPYSSTAKPVESGIDEEKETTDSIRDVAMAGRSSMAETEDMYGSSKVEGENETNGAKAVNKSRSISSVSSVYSEGGSKRAPTTKDDASIDGPRGRAGFEERQPNNLEAIQSHDGNEEEAEEAKDKFSDDKMAPAQKLSSGNGGGAGGSRERSKFIEDL